MNFGKKLRTLREYKGLSPEKLAALSDVSGGYIRRLEASSISPTIETMLKLAKGLNIKPSTLIDTDELQEEAIKDLDLANFFRSELPKLDDEYKNLLRHSISIIRESQKEKYQAEKRD